jgi:DNA repair protein RadD
MKPRSYQRAAVQAVFQYFREGNTGHPLVVAPTGSGKTHILGFFCSEVYKQWPEQKILILTHTKEIISQDVKTLKQYVPPHLVGTYSQGLKARQKRQFTVGGIQSVFRRAEEFLDYNFIIVDEAHLIPPDGEGRYQTFLGHFDVPILGMTATPFRRKHGMLTEGHLFDRIVYNIKIQDLIDSGHLAPLSTKATEYALSTKGLKVIAGDYSKADLSQRLDHQHITKTIVQELLKFKESRKAWLVFAIDIEHCEHITAELHKAGILCAAVHSKLDIDRKHLLDLFKNGHIQAIVSVETLTTGFDAPNVDMIALMRPTTSPVLHVQMLGRGMRVYPNKDKCLVLDFAGNVRRLGPVDAVLVEKKIKKSKGDGSGFTRICPKCSEIVHISKKVCPNCGFVFPITNKLSTSADDSAVLAAQKKIVSKSVNRVMYSKHKKAGKPPSLKVTYWTGLIEFVNEWIAFEHKGYPRVKAEAWWKQHAQGTCPQTVEEALQRQSEIRKPQSIKIDYFDKFPKVIAYDI